jgi:hypothetical protein
MDQINEYVLTDDERGMLQPLMDAEKQIQNEAQVLLRSIIRLRKLEGDWRFQDGKLIKVNTNGSTGNGAAHHPDEVLSNAS